MKRINGKNYLSIPQASKCLGVNASTLHNWIKQRREIAKHIEWFSYPSGRIFIEKESLDRYIEQLLNHSENPRVVRKKEDRSL